MRINHNIAALNTHRQLNSASNAQSKSMEKLSSGLRINRAGDDAAGLAISEKMRAQIRGLDQAATNAQDGISMIQTAEGALTETHEILQRMRELATQSANDTNVDIDREEIQKEMNQLTSEINRIGNTTEFNTQKLLNGGGEVKEIAVNTKQTGGAAGAFKGATDLTAAAAAGAETAVEVISGTTQTISWGDSNASAANNLKVVYAASTAAANATAAFDGKDTITISLGTDAANNTAANVESALTGLDLSAVGVDASEITVATDVGAVATAADLEAGAQTANAVTTAGTEEIVAGSKSANVTASTTSVKAVAAEWNTGDLTAALTDGESGSVSFAGVTISINAEDSSTEGLTNTNQVGSTLTIDSASTTAAADQAQLIVDAFNAVKAKQGDNGSLANFTFEVDGDGIKVTGAAKDGDKNNAFTLTTTGDVAVAGGTTPTTAGVTEVRGEYNLELEKAFEVAGATINLGGEFENAGVTFTAVKENADASRGEFNIGGTKEEQAISLANAINASSLSGRFDALVDGGKITLREKEMQATGVAISNGVVANNESVKGEFSFNVDSSVAVGGKYSVDGVNIEVTDDASHKGLADGTAVLFSNDKTQQASNLANAIAANTKLADKYEVSASADRVTLKQKDGKESITSVDAETSTNKNNNFQASFQIGANTGQSMTIEVEDMRSQALGVSGSETGTVKAKNGAEASYVKVANVSNGTNNESVEFSLDVSSHEKASAAISVINDAIEKVSAQRSNLGAFQNRLEHTINNLNTSSENLTAAESRIRDVDMAKEMMEQTKNSILSQAAQEMLAQSNQMPQGVLQLLR